MALERLPLLVLGFVALVFGVGAGLARLAWPMPMPILEVVPWHGALMVCGFFGVVISLERAVAVGQLWGYGAPLAAGIAGLVALFGDIGVAAWIFVLAGVIMLAATLLALSRQTTNFLIVLTVATACWPIGTLIWALGAPLQAAVGWWISFLVLTIAGERLELSRFLPPSPNATRVFIVIVGVALLALVGNALPSAAHVFGAALVALALWFLRQDIARRTVRQSGLTRFIAVCLLAGYFWLAVSGAVIVWYGLVPGSLSWDAALHGLLLGFVFSMVFGHAPVIFPSVLRVRLVYHPSAYVALVLLHASVLLRVVGDALGAFELRSWGGLGSAVALAAFILGSALSVWRGRPKKKS